MKTPPKSSGRKSSTVRHTTSRGSSPTHKPASSKKTSSRKRIALPTPAASPRAQSEDNDSIQADPLRLKSLLDLPASEDDQIDQVEISETALNEVEFAPLKDGTPIRMHHATIDLDLTIEPVHTIISSLSDRIFSAMRTHIISARPDRMFRVGKKGSTRACASYAALMTKKLRDVVEEERLKARRELELLVEPGARKIWELEKKKQGGGDFAEGKMVFDGQWLRVGEKGTGVKIIRKMEKQEDLSDEEDEYESGDDDVEMQMEPRENPNVGTAARDGDDSDSESDDEEEYYEATTNEDIEPDYMVIDETAEEAVETGTPAEVEEDEHIAQEDTQKAPAPEEAHNTKAVAEEEDAAAAAASENDSLFGDMDEGEEQATTTTEIMGRETTINPAPVIQERPIESECPSLESGLETAINQSPAPQEQPAPVPEEDPTILFCYCQLPHHLVLPVPGNQVFGCDGPKCKHNGWFHEECVKQRLYKKDWPKSGREDEQWLCAGCGGYAGKKKRGYGKLV